jgi:CheY-like chemotaxis protein
MLPFDLERLTMSGTQAFVLLLVVIVAVFVLLLLAIRWKTPTDAELTVEKLFTFKFRVSAADKNNVTTAVADAAVAHGQSRDEAAAQVRSALARVKEVSLKRVLWVDDHPENNINELAALSHLGFVITTLTSNTTAKTFLAKVPFDLVITDLGRDGTTDDGAQLVSYLHSEKSSLPVVVYTMKADERRPGLRAAGAAAVEDRPDALINKVLELVM